MCGRFVVAYSDAFEKLFDLENRIDFTPRYNIRPSEQAPVIRNFNGKNHIDLMKFGFRPDWMTDKYIKEKKRQPYINAKAETVFDTPAFKQAARNSRCLIPVNGFYEPKGTSKPRPQFYFQLSDAKPFALAGIWTERVLEAGEIAQSFAIITTEPNQTMAPIHTRMPAIIEPEAYDLWLSDNRNPQQLKPLLQPWAGEPLEYWQVSSYVNKRDSEGVECIKPV